VIVDFYKMETLCFNITCQLISLSAMRERRKANSKHFSIVTSMYLFLSCGDLFCSRGGGLSDLLPVLLSEYDNYASTICTSKKSQCGAPDKRPY
jgi:hypothetical protein